MEEFAASVGLSRPTVSKYFQDPTSVRRSTRDRIERHLELSNYRPNIYAINQNRSLTNNIGIVVPYLTDPFFTEMARKIEDLTIREHFNPIIFNSRGSPEQEIANLRNLQALKPAGVLLAPLGRTSDRGALQAFCADVPTVLFDSAIEDLGEAFIGSNNSQSIKLIVEYLCETGEPPTFFEMKTPSNPNAIKRRSCYIDVMIALGYEPQLIQAEGSGWDFEKIGHLAGGEALRSSGFRTNTFLCSNDRLAIGMLSAAYSLGLRVGPGAGCAVRIAGHDDHPFSRYTSPKLTTVAQDYNAIAEKSARTLFDLIDRGARAGDRETTLFAGRLVRRDSA